MARANSPHRTRVVVPNATIKADAGGHLPQVSHSLLTINSVNGDNPGTFISARVCKLAGATDDTNVMIAIDGQRVFFENFKTLNTLGLSTGANAYGASVHTGLNNVKTMTIGFPTPLEFTQSLEIHVAIKETDVEKMEATVIWSGGSSIVAMMGPGDPNNGEDPFP